MRSSGPPSLRRHPNVAANGCTRPVWQRKIYDDGTMSAAIPIPCKQWGCERCGKGRLIETIKHISDGFRPGEITRFITITFPLEQDLFADPASCRRVNLITRRIVQEIRRTYGWLEYAKVLETTKRRRLHVHALTRGRYLPKCSDAGRRRHGLPTGPGSGSPCYCAGAALYDMCTDADCPDHARHARPCVQAIAHKHGAGWIDIRKVTNEAAARGYLAKYLAKSSRVIRWPKYVRRYSASRQWSARTLGQIHADHIAEVIRSGHITADDRVVVAWLQCEAPCYTFAGADAPLRAPPGTRLDTRTGQIIAPLPIPF